MYKIVRWVMLRVFGVPPVVVHPEEPGARGFAVSLEWWASREDVFAAVEKAKAEGVVAPGPVVYDEVDLPE